MPHDLDTPRQDELASRATPPVVSRDVAAIPVAAKPKHRWRRRALLALGVLAIGVLADHEVPAFHTWLAAKLPFAASPTAGKAGGKLAGPAAPVSVTVAERRDFPVYLNSLGTAQPTNSVTVRARVDGQIEKILFEEGQLIREGELLVKLDAAPFRAALAQAVAKLAQDEASLKNAKQDLTRTEALSRNGNATLQLFDQRTAQVAQMSAQLLADNAAIQAAKVQLAYTEIAAPISGRVGFRLVDKGNIVRATDANGILTINQLQPISVVFTAPEQHLPEISSAAKLSALETLASSSDGRKQLGAGLLKFIDNQVDQATGSVKLKSEFPNTDSAFWPGLSVATKLRVGTLANVVVVPDSAVQRGPNGLFAYVVGPDNRALLRPLNVGRIADDLAVIEGGITAGERVVTSGHYRVQPGGLLQVQQATADKMSSAPSSTPATSAQVD